MRKTRPDAKLKNLPPEQQEELYEFLKTHTLAKGVEWLAEKGIATWQTSVREFWHWYPLSLEFRDMASVGKAMREARDETPVLPPEGGEFVENGLALFEYRAVKNNDAKQFAALQRVRQQNVRTEQHAQRLAQQQGKLELDRARFQRETCSLFIDWQKQERTKMIINQQIPNSELIERLGRQMFGELWDLEGAADVRYEGMFDCRAG